MNSIPESTLLQLQTLLDSVAAGELPKGELQQQTRGFLAAESDYVNGILATLGPLIHQLPQDFVDTLGSEIQRVINLKNLELDEQNLDFVEEALLRSSPSGRWSWLTLLATMQSENSLDIFVRELLESPTGDSNLVLKAFAPLMQNPRFEADWMFPALFAGINDSILAPIVFDFANFCYRSETCDEHPAAKKKDQFLALLGQLAHRLSEIESDPTAWSSQAEQVSKMISDSVALIVALCDTMALLQYEESIDVLKKVSQIKHRRIRAESTFALAKLGVEAGQTGLLDLVVEPVSRLRVIRYAEELGILDQVEEKYLSDESLAESELALWLSQPNQMGVPPSQIELLKQSTLFWPGFEDPTDCFLFRFEYRLGENTFANVAIVGPLVHAFVANLEPFGYEDQFAAFAGWQAEHDEIFELDLGSLTPHRQTDLFKLERRLHDFGAESIETRRLGIFFGEVFAVAHCTVEEKKSIALVDGSDVRVFPLAEERPIDDEVAFCIYKGTKLIQAFNP